ncbi:MAG TPA: hypothetical protein DD440_05185 [Porticoccaceae bacterium]|nr:hypothetical protein [Porticoccaceae bacterium]
MIHKALGLFADIQVGLLALSNACHRPSPIINMCSLRGAAQKVDDTRPKTRLRHAIQQAKQARSRVLCRVRSLMPDGPFKGTMPRVLCRVTDIVHGNHKLDAETSLTNNVTATTHSAVAPDASKPVPLRVPLR